MNISSGGEIYSIHLLFRVLMECFVHQNYKFKKKIFFSSGGNLCTQSWSQILNLFISTCLGDRARLACIFRLLILNEVVKFPLTLLKAWVTW